MTAQLEKKTLTESDLAQFTGTEQYWKNGDIWWPFVYTDGVQYLAECGQAYWLLDAIASWQIERKVKDDERLGEFQFWTLTVNENCSAELICERDKGDIAVAQEIPFTDFPLRQVRLYLAHVWRYWAHSRDQGLRNTSDYGVLLLPSEY